MRRSPYVVGPWVRGARFYGRHAELASTARVRHLVGLRRVGKTSLLRELELRARGDEGTVPLYWDLEDVEDRESLELGLVDALEDAELPPHVAGVLGAPGAGVPERLGAISDRLRTSGGTLLVLCDEVETLRELDGSVTAVFREGLSRLEPLRLVVASSPRWRIETLGFVADGAVVELLGPLDVDAATRLVRQEHLPAEDRPDLPPASVDAIVRETGGHPYLLQLLAKRTLESGDPGAALEELRGDRSVRFLHEIDLSLLGDAEHDVLRRWARGEETPELSERAERLHALGALGNPFLRHHLRR